MEVEGIGLILKKVSPVTSTKNTCPVVCVFWWHSSLPEDWGNTTTPQLDCDKGTSFLLDIPQCSWSVLESSLPLTAQAGS